MPCGTPQRYFLILLPRNFIRGVVPHGTPVFLRVSSSAQKQQETMRRQDPEADNPTKQNQTQIDIHPHSRYHMRLKNTGIK